MIEVPSEQQATIFDLAQTAMAMTKGACGILPGSQTPGEVTDMVALSPLAAEIFKTLVRCHVRNKEDAAQKRAMNELSGGRQDGPMVAQAPHPGGYQGSRI